MKLKVNKKRIFMFGAVAGLLIFLYFVGILGPIGGYISKILNPILASFYSVGSNIRMKFAKDMEKEELVKRNKELEGEVITLTEENAKYKTIADENETLKEHLNFLTQKNYKYTLASIISGGELLDAAPQIETIMIDKGSKNGIIPGLSVVSGKGIIIGKVAAAHENISEIVLTNNSRCKLAASILSDNKTNGITEGDLGLVTKMEFIPQSAKIKVGDLVITSGLEKNIPRGLIIGKISEVEQENNAIWQRANIEPLVNPENLTIVSVLIP